MRLATLAQAMSRTQATVPRRTRKVGRAERTSSSRSGQQAGPVAGRLRVGLGVGETQPIRDRGHLALAARSRGTPRLHPREGLEHP